MTRPFDRRTLRLPGYDYGQPGAYFVTICTHARALVLGRVSDGEVILSPAGETALACWNELPNHFPRVEAGPVVVMPNHIHGVVIMADETEGTEPHPETRGPRPLPTLEETQGIGSILVGARHASPLPRDGAPRPSGAPPASLGAIVGSYKAAVARRLRMAGPVNDGQVWQRGYYEHVVRDEVDWLRICEYIESNSARWDDDAENPARVRKPARRAGLLHELGKEHA